MRMKKFSPYVIATLLLALIFSAAQRGGGPVHYPNVVVEAQDNLKLEFLQHGRSRSDDCQSAAATIADAIRATCPACRIAAQRCLADLAPEKETLLSEEPVAIPTSRLPDGVVAYSSANQALALAACKEAEKAGGGRGYRVTCFPPNVRRPMTDSAEPRQLDIRKAALSLAVLIFSGLASAFVGYLIVHYEGLHAHWSHDQVGGGPQKFHATPTPRIGGLGLIAGLLVGGGILLAAGQSASYEQFGYLVLASLPAFLGGITEDATKSTRVSSRLLLTMLAAACGAWLLGAVLPRLDIPGVDALLKWTPLAIAFTTFAVGGVANAVNIIDGYNGLAGGIAVIALAALAYVSASVGDGFLVTSALAMMGGLAGFLLWNYPKGKIFLGDGGAYLLGFWLAELSVLLVVRHPEVSPWFPMLLVVYPVFETIFSIYRRNFTLKQSPGTPDRLHLHQLIYTCLFDDASSSANAEILTRQNSKVAPYGWLIGLCCAVPAVLLWKETVWLVTASVLFCVWYVWLYMKLQGLATHVENGA
jgi:UDP-GlcNAc:undecaprenyl-phosphate/decaprenyl-phosphate GlcNAc-1-phosphate transferase